jgi:LmbE family N-acetylglucosaminyl deacetylase
VQLASSDVIGPKYRHLYVSPHFDDIALSAGGTALLQARRGEPLLVVCVFTAPPPDALTGFAEFQHDRWGGAADPWRERQEEERKAMAALGADYLWLDYSDAIYRSDQYLSDVDLFGPVKPGDARLRQALSGELARAWQRSPRATVYLPLGVGGHVDHQLCGAAADNLRAAGAPLAWYEDAPYSMTPGAVEARLGALDARLQPLTVEIGELVDEKVRLVETYRSQVAWIFRSYGEAGAAIRRQAAGLSALVGGHAERLWVGQAKQ